MVRLRAELTKQPLAQPA